MHCHMSCSMPHLSNMMARSDTAIGVTASDVADAIDICRIELKKGARIPPNVILLNHRDELVSFCCGGKDDIIDENCVELCTLVEEMKQLKEQKVILLSKRGTLKSLPSKRDYVLAESELDHILTRLSANQKRFCAKLLKHPLIAANIEKLDSSCNDFANVLATAVGELREQGTYRVLQQNVNKSKCLNSFRRRGEKTAGKAREAKNVVSKLHETFQTERDNHDGRVRDLESESSRIAKELAAIHDGTDMASTQNRLAMNKKVSAANRDAEQAESDLRADVDKLQRLAEKAARDHQGGIRQIQSDIEELESKASVQHKLLSTEDLAEAQLQDATAKREKNLKVLVELQRRWDRDEAEKRRLDDEREAERLQRLQEKAEEAHRRLCVTKISVAYRIYLKKKKKNAAAAQKSKKGKKGGKAKKAKKT